MEKTKTLLNLRTRWVILMKTMEEKKYNHIELIMRSLNEEKMDSLV